LQLLLLRIAFQYALPLSSEEVTAKHPAIQRTCKIWKNGIYWENEDLVAALVELVDPGRKVNILIRCQQGRASHVPLLRSRLVQDVLKIRNEVCKNIIIKELILHPQAVASYPIDAPKDKTVYGTKLARAIANHMPGVFNLAHGTTSISELLLYDPYSNDEHCKQEIEYLLERHNISVSDHHVCLACTYLSCNVYNIGKLSALQKMTLNVTDLYTQTRTSTLKNAHVQSQAHSKILHQKMLIFTVGHIAILYKQFRSFSCS